MKITESKLRSIVESVLQEGLFQKELTAEEDEQMLLVIDKIEATLPKIIEEFGYRPVAEALLITAKTLASRGGDLSKRSGPGGWSRRFGGGR